MKKKQTNKLTLPSGKVITEIPLICSPPMVSAILGRIKNQTRRAVKTVEITPGKIKGRWNYSVKKGKRAAFALNVEKKYFHSPLVGFLDFCPYGKPGDLLWIRENWVTYGDHVYFQADGRQEEIIEDEDLDRVRWKPSIHIRKADARIWAMITEIRVEQLHDITETDACNEGIKMRITGLRPFIDVYQIPGHPTLHRTAKAAFSQLWRYINGPDSWELNPWVWVIKFKVLSTGGKPHPEEIEHYYNEQLEQTNQTANGRRF